MKPFILQTGVSAYVLGAALLQGEGQDECPVEYAIRILSPAEMNDSTTETEALAVVWVVSRFRGYLEETLVIIITDHQPLNWRMFLKSRWASWALKLKPYDLRIEYTPGRPAL